MLYLISISYLKWLQGVAQTFRKSVTHCFVVSGVCGQDTPSLKTILDPVFYTFAGLVVVGMTLVLVYINR